MADLSNVTFQPQNPDALFSPDQWLNQFSRFNDKALPWPSSYTGYPTDAMGNFIDPQAGSGIPTQAQWQANQAAPQAPAASAPPGTTLNSSPVGYMIGMTPQYKPPTGGFGGQGSTISGYSPQFSSPSKLGTDYDTILAGASPQQLASPFGQATLAAAQAKGGLAPGYGAAPQQAAPAAPNNNLTYPQVLSLLANPGKVTTPGATVPASPTSAQPSSGALQSFLQSFRPATSGPGSGFQQDFSKTLKGMGYG